MSDPAATSDPTAQTGSPAAPKDALRGVMERQLSVLGRLAEAGLNLALAIERQATTEGAAQVVSGDVALAYGRVSRAVRLTVALQAKVVKELQGLDQVAARELYADRCNAERERLRLAKLRQDRVQRIVERVIAAEVADAAEVDRLADEACERLEHDDIYGDLTTRPVGEIIAPICRDLDLSPDWTRPTPRTARRTRGKARRSSAPPRPKTARACNPAATLLEPPPLAPAPLAHTPLPCPGARPALTRLIYVKWRMWPL
jgi:hypothetical protein